MPSLAPRDDERKCGRLSHPPRLTIVVELEGRPQLYIDALHFEDEQRLRTGWNARLGSRRVDEALRGRRAA